MVVKIESKAKGLCGHVSWCIQIKIQYFHTHTIWPLPLPRHTSTVWWEDGMEQMRAQQVHGLRIDYHWGQGDIDRWQMKPRDIPTQDGTRTGISPFTIKTIPVFFSLHHLSSPFLSALYPPPNYFTTTKEALVMALMQTLPPPTAATTEHWQRDAVSERSLLETTRPSGGYNRGSYTNRGDNYEASAKTTTEAAAMTGVVTMTSMEAVATPPTSPVSNDPHTPIKNKAKEAAKQRLE